MKKLESIIEKILKHKNIERYCCGCGNTTRQAYEPDAEKKYDDAISYRCLGCGSIRYYGVSEEEKKKYKSAEFRSPDT